MTTFRDVLADPFDEIAGWVQRRRRSMQLPQLATGGAVLGAPFGRSDADRLMSIDELRSSASPGVADDVDPSSTGSRSPSVVQLGKDRHHVGFSTHLQTVDQAQKLERRVEDLEDLLRRWCVLVDTAGDVDELLAETLAELHSGTS